MAPRRRANKKITAAKYEKIRSFLEKIKKMDNNAKLDFFKSIPEEEIDIICEILINIINENLKLDVKTFMALRSFKDYLYNIIPRNKSYFAKRKLLATVKGLHMVSVLLPLLTKCFSLS